MAAGPMRDMFREARGVVARSVRDATGEDVSRPARPARPPTRAEIQDVVRTFVRGLAGTYTIVVPGQHTGGISHMDLIGVLASQGRDFLQATVQLTQALRAALLREFAGASKLPTIEQLQRATETPLLEHVERRFERGNGDVAMQPLTARYRAQKIKAGRGGQPIGVATGELRAAFSRKAKVVWKR